MATLSHPHIIRMLDFDVQQGMAFFVMEYAQVGSLRKLHPRGSRLPLATVVAYIKQVAEALQHAHDHHFVYRDIKPENILLSSTGSIVLSDFGMATLLRQTRWLSPRPGAGTFPSFARMAHRGWPGTPSHQ